jgi:hypothetical protein
VSDHVISDAGAGRALFLTRMKLTVHAVSMSMWSGAVPGLILPVVFWVNTLKPADSDVLKETLVSRLVPASTPRKWELRNADGTPSVVTVTRADGAEIQLMTPAQFRAVARDISPVMTSFTRVGAVSLVCAILGYTAVWRSLARMGKKARANKLVRGKEDVVSPKELSKQVRKREPGSYRILDARLPKTAPMQGIMFQGAQGTGKSIGMEDLMQQVFARKKKCVIYDHSGEYYRKYFRPGKDYFFNPALLGSVPWSIFSELVHTYDSNTLAQAFLPPKAGVVHGASAFFEDAARALFSVMLYRLAARGACNTRVISEAILEMPEDELELLIQKSVASSAVGGDSKGQRQGVISSIAIYLDGIAAVPDGDWSLRRFFDVDDDARFFIVNTDDTKAMFAPLYRLLLTVAFGAIAAKQQVVYEDRYWFFLDEVAQLGDIKLDEAQATLRKYGVSVVTGIQADKQYFTTMGQDRGETLMNGFNTMVMLRTPEPNMAKRMAERLTKREMEVVSEGQAVAVSEWRDGGNMNQNEQEKWLVMPGEISTLDNCVAYLQFPGSYSVAKVDYRHWLPKWYRPWARVNRFRVVQDTPPRDPRFRVLRTTGQDALASVRADAEQARAEKAAAEAAAEAIEKGGEWILVDDDSGEITPASAPQTQEELPQSDDAAAAGQNDPEEVVTTSDGLFSRSLASKRNGAGDEN